MRLSPAKEVILVVPDLHCPFQHPQADRFLEMVKDRYKPTKIVILGDEIDSHALSRYPHNPDGHSAGHELKYAISELKAFYHLFPEALVCVSNHTVRYKKKAYDAGIPERVVRDYNEVLEAPKGWVWKGKHHIDGIDFIHGDVGQGGIALERQLALKSVNSVVFGHIHAHAGIKYVTNENQMKFGMNVGCLIDPNAYAFDYGKNMVEKPWIGCGIINKGIPVLLPMRFEKSKPRWIGEL